MIYHEEKLLILTKTYPHPSANYIEHTCVVAVNDQGELRRLFPIPFRLLDENRQFQKWQWISAKISRDSEKRPETHRIDVDSIALLERIGTKRDWADRLQWINPHLFSGFTELEETRLKTNQSLGFIKPKNIRLEIIPTAQPNWTERELINLKRQSLFQDQNINSTAILKKLPYDFYYQYDCQVFNSLESNRHKITDWEMGALFWNCQSKYGPNWEKPFRQMFEETFNQKDLIFLMGNMRRFQDQWLIVGLIYPPQVEARQYPLWTQAPNEK